MRFVDSVAIRIYGFHWKLFSGELRRVELPTVIVVAKNETWHCILIDFP